jgi:TetR/AcrR family transcriptional regulator, mexCD-oprJ operon repressor
MNDEPGLRRDAAANRDAVLDAATTVLLEDPRASVADVAAAAGVGRATVYRRFPTREALVTSLIRRLFEEADAIVTAAIAVTGRSALDLVAEMTTGFVGLGERYRFLLAHRGELDATGKEVADPHLEQAMLELVQAGQARGELRADVPAQWALVLMRGVSQSCSEAIARDELTAADALRLADETMRTALAPR